LKIVHIYRAPKPNRYSIERVFAIIERNLPAEVVIERFYLDPYASVFANIRRASKLKADVFHITGDCNYVVLGLPRRKTIITVHDVGHYEVTLKGLRKIVYGCFWWKLPLKVVKQIVAISNFTKERIERNFSIPSESIKVIYDPLPPNLTPETTEFNEKKPTILQIGSGKNKNVYGLIRALQGLTAKLILINDVDDEIIRFLLHNRIEYEQYHNLPYDEVIAIYKRTDILFFASFYEGFGMPIIEAQSLGIPVVTSNVGPMPEVAGEGALLVNPFSVAEIRNALVRIINSSFLRDELVKKGKENVKRFRSKVIAEEYYNVYRTLSTNGD
jgi:glycosyltransferase involved in cell wall biosynthesis